MQPEVSPVNNSNDQTVKRRPFAENVLRVLKLLRKYAVLSFTPGKVKIYVVILIFTLVAYLFVRYFVSLVFMEQRLAKQNSYTYSLLINDFVKEIPEFKPLEYSQKKFYYQISAKKTVPINIVTYQSQADTDEIISYYRLYFEILNYSIVEHGFDSKSIAIFINTREGFNVFVEQHENSRIVHIEYFELK